MSEAEAERSGLVPTHAYAVLDVRKIKVWLWLYRNPLDDIPRIKGTDDSCLLVCVCMTEVVKCHRENLRPKRRA
jgi:hypothetical protein